MKNHKLEKFATMLVHATSNRVGPIASAVVPSAAFGYESATEAEGIFDGSVQKPLYARVGNPTNAKLEQALSQMEGGAGAVVTSSGMGALSLACFALLQAGDEVLCIGGFFGGTYTLVSQTLSRFGVKSSFCRGDELEYMEEKLRSGVKLVIFESVGNPSLTLPDMGRIIELCNEHSVISLVDNTTTPLIVRPLDLGADIVMHSTTKNISGFAGPLGGAIIFRSVDEQNDKLHNQKYASLHKFIKKAGKNAFMPIFKKRALRDIGMSASALSSHLTLLGLETLALRIDRINSSTLHVAKMLHGKMPDDIQIIHPSLPSNRYHKIYKRDYLDGCGPLIGIECKTKQKAFALLDNLKLSIQTANIGDNRTLALHMASTIYSDFDDEQKSYLGVTDGLIRVSIGLEDPDAIVEDFLQASKGRE